MGGRVAGRFSRGKLRAIPCLLAAASFVAVGCGGNANEPTYSAGGTVRLPDGSPLPAGFISFRSMDNSRPLTARGELDTEGNFELSTFEPGDGAVAGRH